MDGTSYSAKSILSLELAKLRGTVIERVKFWVGTNRVMETSCTT